MQEKIHAVSIPSYLLNLYKHKICSYPAFFEASPYSACSSIYSCTDF